MKWLLTLLMLISLNVFADPIVIEIGGVKHVCTPIGTGSAGQCILTAENGPFSHEEASLLCTGAFNDAPARCAIDAYNGIFSKEQCLTLCSGATSTGPFQCVNTAYNGPFTIDESIRLCSNDGTENTAVCALQAYSGRYSKEESIDLCKSHNHFNEKNLLGKKFISKEELIKLIKKANLKAFTKNEYK